MLQKDTVCVNISDLWLGLGLESQDIDPRPRLQLYVHFSGQIDKKTPKHITLPDALFFTWANLLKFGADRERNIPYLSVFPICSVLPLEDRRVRPSNIKLIDTCGSRLIATRQLLTIS